MKRILPEKKKKGSVAQLYVFIYWINQLLLLKVVGPAIYGMGFPETNLFLSDIKFGAPLPSSLLDRTKP